MSLDALYDSLGIPAAAQIDRRVAKTLLVEKGDLSPADRRLADSGLERLTWRATLKPGNVGLSAFHDHARDYSEIVVMAATLKAGAKAPRLAEIIHRAIAHPLVLLVADEAGASMSTGLKRRHEREADRVVVERLTASPLVHGDHEAVQQAFLASLTLARIPARDLWSLHTGWSERIEAFVAARITGAFRLAADDDEAEVRRQALADHAAQARAVEQLRKAARADGRLNRRVELSREAAQAKAELARVIARLA